MKAEPGFMRIDGGQPPSAGVEGDFEFTDDVLDAEVWWEIRFAYERACGVAAAAQGADLNDWEEARRWARYRYVEGDPLVRAAAYFATIGWPRGDFREAPYWVSVNDVGQYVFIGEDTLLYSPELDDARRALVDRCAGLVEAEGVGPEDEAALRAWVKGRYDGGDATVRAAVLAEAACEGVHDINLGGRDDAPYLQCERDLAEAGGAIFSALWDRHHRHGGGGPVGGDRVDGLPRRDDNPDTRSPSELQ